VENIWNGEDLVNTVVWIHLGKLQLSRKEFNMVFFLSLSGCGLV